MESCMSWLSPNVALHCNKGLIKPQVYCKVLSKVPLLIVWFISYDVEPNVPSNLDGWLLNFHILVFNIIASMMWMPWYIVLILRMIISLTLYWSSNVLMRYLEDTGIIGMWPKFRKKEFNKYYWDDCVMPKCICVAKLCGKDLMSQYVIHSILHPTMHHFIDY